MATKAVPDETVLASEVPRRFGGMLNDLLRGKSFTITRNGQPIGRFIPIDEPDTDRGDKKK